MRVSLHAPLCVSLLASLRFTSFHRPVFCAHHLNPIHHIVFLLASRLKTGFLLHVILRCKDVFLSPLRAIHYISPLKPKLAYQLLVDYVKNRTSSSMPKTAPQSERIGFSFSEENVGNTILLQQLYFIICLSHFSSIQHFLLYRFANKFFC